MNDQVQPDLILQYPQMYFFHVAFYSTLEYLLEMFVGVACALLSC